MPPVVMTFAATDPTGGAGLQADLLTFAALGCHGLSVVTGTTVQDTMGVDSFQPLDAEYIADQARQVLEDIPVHAFKIGLVNDVENISIIADIISDYPDVPVILDPVLASGCSDELSTDDAIEALRELLIPQATIITPNSLEARRLFSDNPDDSILLEHCAYQLIELGAEWVLIKGAHENTPNVINSLYNQEGVFRQDTWERLPGSYHGSGCTLSSAIAANLAMGMPVPYAVGEAQAFTWQSLCYGFRPGMGQYIPDRMFWARLEETEDNH